MTTFSPRVLPRFASPWLACAALFVSSLTVSAQVVEKMADFRASAPPAGGGAGSGSATPYDNPILINNQLWFTTQGGGRDGFGTVSYYDLATRTITAYASLDSTGNTPQSSLTQIGDTLYFTNSRGGVGGDGGGVYSVQMGQSNPVVNRLTSFGSTATSPRNPGGNLTPVDRGANGTDLYFTTPNGGTGDPATPQTGAAYGVIAKYNTSTGATSIVHNFSGSGLSSGRQPTEGFTNVGGKLYFTTFTGGANVVTGFGNGTGTLSVLDPTNDSVTTLASMPAGSASLPSHNVTSTGNGMLYFTTTGNAANPGSLQSFNLSTGTLTTLVALSAATGRNPYGSVLALNNVLYFTTLTGGTYNQGTVNAFDLNTNSFIKLFDLDGSATDNRTALGRLPRTGLTLVNENGRDYLYLLVNAGGANNQGTILRITPIAVPEPGTVALLMTAGAGGWLWRRGREKKK